jgi:hypothetical protein
MDAKKRVIEILKELHSYISIYYFIL